MPFKNSRTINISEATKRRLASLRGTYLGQSYHAVVKSLLDLADKIPKINETPLDNMREVSRIITNDETSSQK